MALVKATLKASLEDIFDGTTDVSTIDKAAGAWSAAYKGYASLGQDCSAGVPLSPNLTAAETTLKAAIKAAFTAGLAGGLSPAIATTFATAFTAFWLTPPMVFATTGLVTGVTGTAALATALQGIWIANAAPGQAPTASAVADAHANALDTFSKTVMTAQTIIPCTGLLS